MAAILRHVSDGYCCQLLGPRHHLKSRLVQFAGALLTEFGTHHVVSLDLVAVHPDEQFFTALDAHTRASLSPQLSGPPVDECQSATELQVALVRYALASDRNLLLIIDHLEIAPPNQVASLLSAVRAAHIASMDDYGSRLQVIVCGSMLLSQVALRDADRYERISKTITMQDLSREEGKRLLNAYNEQRSDNYSRLR